MTAGIRSVTASPAWKALEAHHQKVRELHLHKLFGDDPKRGERMTIEAMGIYPITRRIALPTKSNPLPQLKNAVCEPGSKPCFGRKNQYHRKPGRPALHFATESASIVVDASIYLSPRRARKTDFSNRVRSGEWKGHTGKRIRNIINIGIGGSTSDR
jgi:glucose-6-phosphate isomerase